MNPSDFLTLATDLAKRGGAAALRSASSRAYYAVYNQVVELVDKVVPISRGPQAHKEVQRILLASQDVQLIEVGSDLGDLHSRRCDADYRLDRSEPENPKTVQATLIEANAMMDALQAVFIGASATEIKRRIQRYWTDIERRPLQGRKRV